jgi:hypothetical protein
MFVKYFQLQIQEKKKSFLLASFYTKQRKSQVSKFRSSDPHNSYVQSKYAHNKIGPLTHALETSSYRGLSGKYKRKLQKCLTLEISIKIFFKEVNIMIIWID